jgi:hypothetical protein
MKTILSKEEETEIRSEFSVLESQINEAEAELKRDVEFFDSKKVALCLGKISGSYRYLVKLFKIYEVSEE